MGEYSDYAWDWRKNLPPLPTMFGGAFDREPPSVAPMITGGAPGAAPPPAVPILPDVEKNRPPVPPSAGPGYATSPVGNPVGVKFPSGMPMGDFGNPTPKAADGQPGETEAEAKARILKAYLESKDFSGALGAIGKGLNKKPAGPMAPVFHVSPAAHMSGGKDLSQAGGGFMSKALEELGKFNLMAGRKPGEQGRYDILNKRQSSINDLLKQLG
jgi:hypothetical protein